MKAERWHQIEQLFHAALQRDPQDRAAFLLQKCEGDQSLFSEVKSLLNSSGQGDSFFEESASALAAEMFGDRVGETLGPYQILSVLGAGGMGTVYLAHDTRLGRKIALKLLPSQFTNDKDRLRRFQQEARAASALNHPNILTVHEIEQKADLHYIATEFIDGLTLRQRISNGPMNLAEALKVAIQVATALEAAHAAGIAHRDIKPENVMIRSDGYVKVLDFGLAKLTEHPSTVESDELVQFAINTDPGVVMGTPRYMSPEQARGLDVDARTDIFSLGVMIYEMVSGSVPFDGATPSDVIAALLKDEPEPLAESIPEFPTELDRIVNRALSKNRDKRYQTIAELFADLEHLTDQIQLNPKLGHPGSAGSLSRVISSRDEPLTAPRLFKSTDPEVFKETESIERKKRGLGFVFVMSALVLVTVISVIFLTRPAVITPRVMINQNGRRLTYRPGFVTASRFKPDGNGVVYSAGFDGQPLELFVGDLRGSEARSVKIPSAALKAVSPTGDIAVLFDYELSWNEGRNGTLALVPANGAEPRVLMEGVDEVAFTPDGTGLAIVRASMGEHHLEYPQGEVLYKSPGWIAYPRFSPQGDKIAFMEHPLGDSSGSILILDLKTKLSSTLTSNWNSLKGLAWAPKGDEIWFGGSKLGKKQKINAVSLSGQLRLDMYDVQTFARLDDISADGQMLICNGNTLTTMVLLNNESSGKIVNSPFAWSISADLSADGNTLLFYERGYERGDTGSSTSVYLRKLDDSMTVRLGDGKAVGLSPDGKWALALQEKSPPELVLLPTGGGVPRPLPNPGIKEYHYASWFPDGRRILFTAIEAAFIRSYVQDTETGEVHPITEEGTVALRVSPNGKNVITLPPDQIYYVQPLDGTEPTPIPGLESNDEPIQWSADSRAVFVHGPGEFSTKIFRVEITSGRKRLVNDIVPSNRLGLIGLELNPGGILITPDGKVCVYTYWTAEQELMLLDGLKQN
jgi:serine/threonine protein kinase/Tol biopolymer transport system component